MHLKSLFYVSFYHNPEVCCFVSFVLFALGLLAALFVWNASYFFPLFTHRASWVWTWYHVSHEILSKHACARGMIVHEVKWNIPIILFICQNFSKEYRLWTYLPKVVWLVNKGVNCIEMKGPGHLTSCSSMWSLCYVRSLALKFGNVAHLLVHVSRRWIADLFNDFDLDHRSWSRSRSFDLWSRSFFRRWSEKDLI